MNKILLKEKNELTLSKNEKKEIYLLTKEDFSLTINLCEHSHLTIYQYHINQNANIDIHLNGENATVEYHFSTINYHDHKIKIDIEHHAPNTSSYLYNHGVNVENHELTFDIVGKIVKNMKGCICNQENQIINLKEGKSTILPKLEIDHYDITSTHSAYIGKFKDDVLFYLMSRGLSFKKANELLMKGLLMNQGNIDKEEVIQFQKEIESI